MDLFFKTGILIIQSIQSRLWEYRNLLIGISHMGDPKNVYLILFPALFSVNRACGIKTLCAACISEYINLILKWIIQEDRPYWWVFENPGKWSGARLHQFPITCETGPGSPSGHVMVTAAVWYVVICQAVQQQRLATKVLAWIFYLFGLLFVAISRMFLAAHFPHQCALGFFIGVAIGDYFSRLNETQLNTKRFSSASIVTFASSLAVYYLLPSFGRDPDRSVELATRWCSKKEYIHLDTTPLYCSMRYSGSLLGCGLALWIKHATYFEDRYRLTGRVALTVLGTVFTRFLTSLPLPDDPLMLYSSSFIVYSVMTIILAGTVPRLLNNKRKTKAD